MTGVVGCVTDDAGVRMSPRERAPTQKEGDMSEEIRDKAEAEDDAEGQR